MKKWLPIAAGSLVALLAVVIGINVAIDSKFLSPSKTPPLASSLSAIKVDAAAQAKCQSLAAAIPTAPTVQAWKLRSQMMNTYAAGSARQASTFVNSTSWIVSTDLPDVSADLAKVLTGGLDDIIAKTDTIRVSDRQAFANLWAKDFQNLAIKKCGLTGQVADAAAAEASFSASKDALVSLAASVPWYPDGFSEWSGDSNIAWKWVEGYDCNLGDWCWHIKVTTATGCPQGLYAEMNILDSADNVVDYANDTVPSLGAGATAVLEFATYNTTHASGQMATITCNGD